MVSRGLWSLCTLTDFLPNMYLLNLSQVKTMAKHSFSIWAYPRSVGVNVLDANATGCPSWSRAAPKHVYIVVAQDRVICNQLLYMVKGILMVFLPHPGRILVSELSHWFTFVGQMGNKLGQLVYKSKKALHSFDFFCPRASSWAWHFLDCTDHLRVRLYYTWC